MPQSLDFYKVDRFLLFFRPLLVYHKNAFELLLFGTTGDSTSIYEEYPLQRIVSDVLNFVIFRNCSFNEVKSLRKIKLMSL